MAVSKSSHFQQLLSKSRPSDVAFKHPDSSKSCDRGIEKQIFVPGSFPEEERSRTGCCALPSEPNHICNVECGKSIHESANNGDECFSRRDSVGSLASSQNLPSGSKQISNNLNTHPVDADSTISFAIENGFIDESAIDDGDDSSDWEDSIDESGKPSVDEKFFQRVESKVNLASRPSLITLMMANDRVKSLGNHASQSTSALSRSRSVLNGSSLAASPNDSDDGPLMMKGTRQSTLRPINEIPRSNAQPIATTNHVHAQAALSPRTTRRNMLATELTESLRRHLLWERQQKSSTANAVLKRRHTSHDVANLKQYPERACLKQSEDVNASSWNQYFTKEANNGYHSKGW